MESGGYSSYTVLLDSKVKLPTISLNTAMYSPGPHQAWPRPSQPVRLAEPYPVQTRVYQRAHLTSIRLVLIGAAVGAAIHREVPRCCREVYAHLITAQLFGHTHKDEFRVHSDLAMPPMRITGAVSVIYSNNPPFRVVDYDRATAEVQDWSVYRA